jgi:hypothetical protein
VFALHRTRAYAATLSWKRAEEASVANREELRNRAKTYAREWLDFARSAGKDTKEAEELCISAASRQACGL